MPAPREREPYTMGYGPAITAALATRTAAEDASFLLPLLGPGMTVLDCGCGPGSITLDLAALVGDGRAVGVDVEASQTEHARREAERRGIANARFETASVYALPFDDASYDVVFACALFGNVRDRAAALAEMRRVLRPGGIVAIREFDTDADVDWPPHPMRDLAIQLYRRLRHEHGHEGSSGRRVRALLHEAGFDEVVARAVVYSAGSPDEVAGWSRSRARLFREEFNPRFLERGWIDAEAASGIVRGWESMVDEPGAYSTSNWVEALGRAPASGR